jgi:hypothetical protein
VAVCSPLLHSCAGRDILERRIKIKDKNIEEYNGSEGKVWQ